MWHVYGMFSCGFGVGFLHTKCKSKWGKSQAAIKTCTCWSWRRLGAPDCLKCNHSNSEWPPGLHRSWSWWQSRSPCTCSSADRGSLSHFAPRRTGRKVAKADSLPYPEPSYRWIDTSQCHWPHLWPAMDSLTDRQPMASIWVIEVNTN